MNGTITVAVTDLVSGVVGGASFLATATDAAPTPAPWYESQLLGVVAGALLGLLGSLLLAAHGARTADRRASEQREFDRTELRRGSRKAACLTFLAEARKARDNLRNYEQEYGQRYGDMYPEEYGKYTRFDEALADLAVEVPEAVYKAAVHLRDVLDIYVWEWDVTKQEKAHATDEDVESAETKFRRAMRDLLADA